MNTSGKEPGRLREETDLKRLFPIRPEQLEKLPPCQAGCPNSGDIRGWIGTIAQHKKLGLTFDAACAQAWTQIAELNPFPATLGRICPHPCQDNCNRADKDGAVAINAMERFLGDWALENKLSLPRYEGERQHESIGVIGAGPAGLSFAYQMARQGYRITVYERFQYPGGMLRYGIPVHRLPEDILAEEIERISKLGVEIKPNTEIGKDISIETLREQHDVLFFGVGAPRSLNLNIPGSEGPGVWSGTAYLALRRSGARCDLGARVVVIGGGNTAIDTARSARREGAEVVVLYRRSRAEMPAIAQEVDEALVEDVKIEYLATPKAIRRDGQVIRSVIVQKMELGEPDSYGRRRPIPVRGEEYELEASSVIVAISKVSESEALAAISSARTRVEANDIGKVEEGVWVGGDVLGPGIAGLAIAQGRRAAEAVHAELRGITREETQTRPPVGTDQVKTEFYAEQTPLIPPRRPEEEWLENPYAEIEHTITEEEFRREAGRCFSCGLCFGCQQCWMYCNPGSYVHMDEVRPGRVFRHDTGQMRRVREMHRSLPIRILECIVRCRTELTAPFKKGQK